MGWVCPIAGHLVCVADGQFDPQQNEKTLLHDDFFMTDHFIHRDAVAGWKEEGNSCAPEGGTAKPLAPPILPQGGGRSTDERDAVPPGRYSPGAVMRR